MLPFERYKKLNTEGNLWIYILSLGKEGPVIEENARKLIFERFGFLPSAIPFKRVLFRLGRQGLIEKEKFKGKKAFKTTKTGEKELEKMCVFCQEMLKTI